MALIGLRDRRQTHTELLWVWKQRFDIAVLDPIQLVGKCVESFLEWRMRISREHRSSVTEM